MIHACPLRNYSFKNVFYRNVFYFISPTPSFTPQTMLDACIQNFFRVSILYRVGGGGEGELQENFDMMHCLWGNLEMTEKYEYCSIAPRTLPRIVWILIFGGKSLFSSFFLHFYCIVSFPNETKNMQWYIFLLLSSPNERTLIWNIASTCMINCFGVQ